MIFFSALFLLFAQTGNPGNFDTVFPAFDAVGSILLPFEYGVDGFAARIEHVRDMGREPIGLVLTGGSARAYAHIGVLRVLEQAGIVPDFIVANSMGAVVGMLYAAGFSPDLIQKTIEQIPPERFMSLVLPGHGGFLNAGGFIATVSKIVDGIDLKDTPIPILVVAEDLKTRRQVRFAEGDFARIMAASFAMPAVFEPALVNGHALVDGGSTNLVPVAIARDFSSRLIVSTTFYDRSMSYTNPLSILNRTFDIGKTRAGLQQIQDVNPFIIRNDVEHFSFMEFSDPHAIIGAGEMSASAALADVRTYLGIGLNSGLNGLDEALQVRRDYYAGRVPGMIRELVFGALPTFEPTSRYKLRFKLSDAFGYSVMSLDDQSYFGLFLASAVGKIRFNAGMMAGLAGVAGHQWGAIAEFIANPADTFKFTSAARLWGDFASYPTFFLQPKSAEIAGSLSWTSQTNLSVVPFVEGKAAVSLADGQVSWLARVGSKLSLISAKHLEFSAGLDFFIDNDDGSSLRYGPEGMLTLGYAEPLLGAVRLHGAMRQDFSANGLSFSAGDAFRGTTPSGTAPTLAAAGLDLVWFAKSLEFAAGEVILVRNIEIGPYLDLAWKGFSASDGYAPDAFAVGLNANLSVSLVGLAPFDVACYAAVSSSGTLMVGLRSERLHVRPAAIR